MELVSIIIPVYNIADYVKDCIESVRLQTYSDLEIIVVDDGSTDGSAQICDALAVQDARITVIHKENGGVSSARNSGIETAKGKYIAFIDGDDWVEETYVETLYRSMKEAEADVAAVGFVYRYSDGKNKPQSIADELTVITAREALDQACGTSCPWTGFACGKLVRKDILDDHGIKFDTTIRICEDSLFWYEVFENARFAVKNPEMLYNYRIRETSATRLSRKSLDAMRTKITALEKATVIARRHPGTQFLHNVEAAVFAVKISYIAAMFTLKQFETAEVQAIREELLRMKNPQLMRALSSGVKVRFWVLAASPKTLYWLEQVKAKVR